jgi:hypothetical protein
LVVVFTQRQQEGLATFFEAVDIDGDGVMQRQEISEVGCDSQRIHDDTSDSDEKVTGNR